jgi:hypothetical protein
VTRKELIPLLREQGISAVYGKSLSRATKKEMESIARFLDTGRGVRYFSPSQMTTYLTCGMRYYWRYIENLKMPPGWYMTLGSAVDTAVTVGYEMKIATGRDTPMDVATDSFVQDLKARAGETDWMEQNHAATEKLGVEMVKVWAGEVQPQREPLRTQCRHLVKFAPGTGYGLYGIRDTDMAGDEVVDLKTSTKARTTEQLQDDFQLLAYGVSYMDQFGVMPTVGHDTLLRNKKGTEFGWDAAARFKPSPEQAQWLLKRLAMVADGVHRGVFLPPSPASQQYFRKICSKASCGYFERCHKELS